LALADTLGPWLLQATQLLRLVVRVLAGLGAAQADQAVATQYLATLLSLTDSNLLGLCRGVYTQFVYGAA